MTKATVASLTPYSIEVIAGKNYLWCACGKSTKQPFCDGSHKGTDIQPVNYHATKSRTVFFCGCKKTQKSPLCDGQHNKL